MALCNAWNRLEPLAWHPRWRSCSTVLFARVQKIAEVISRAQGFVPEHCLSNTEVCFAIATRALVWSSDPFAVCQSTYQPVEGGKVAYEAKLVQAILNNSGRLTGRSPESITATGPRFMVSSRCRNPRSQARCIP